MYDVIGLQNVQQRVRVMMEGLDEVKRMTWVNARMSRSGERRQGAGADWAALHPGW